MRKIDCIPKENDLVVITGHARPDGDCVGSCLGLFHYLKAVRPDLSVFVCLDEVNRKFSKLPGFAEIVHDESLLSVPDVLFVLDCADEKRPGVGRGFYRKTKNVVWIDHHMSDGGFAADETIVPDASSTAELLFDLFDRDRINLDCAACLYTGLLHDTGGFKHSCTRQSTMNAAGFLMNLGVDFTAINAETFYQKTYAENRITGAVLQASKLYLDGKVVVGTSSLAMMKEYGVTFLDMDGIVDALNETAGVFCTIFLYETKKGVYKASLRSKDPVRVNEIASSFGGGGHVRAAGCNLTGTAEDAIRALLLKIEKQLAADGEDTGETI